MKTIWRNTLTVVATLWLFSQPLAVFGGANLIINGGFEMPRVPAGLHSTFSAPSTFDGWMVWVGEVDIVDTNHFSSASGLQSLDVNGLMAGGVSQDVTNVPGESYRLRFAFAGNPHSEVGCSPLIKRMEVRWGTNVVATVEHDATGRTPTDVGWREFAFTVTGTGLDRLSFLSLTPGCAGPALDNVSLTTATNAIIAVEGVAIAKAVQLCWPTTAGRNYQVQWTLNVESNVWTYFGNPIFGDGTTNCIYDPLGTNPRRFYRVLESE